MVKSGRRLIAIEVKSGRRRDALPGMEAFKEKHPSARTLLVGADGIPVQEFLERTVEEWVAG